MSAPGRLAMSYEEALKEYSRFEFDDGHFARTVYRRGQGPGVIVIHEIPGLHPLVIRFADRVAAAGMTVFLPSLFGEPGRPVSLPYAVKEMFKNVCIRRGRCMRSVAVAVWGRWECVLLATLRSQ
jgi:dienelactone hydrolase